MPFLLIFFQEEIVILLTYIIVGNAQYQTDPACAGDGQHAIIKEQTGEDFRVGNFGSGKGRHSVSDNFSLFGDFAQHTFAVPVQFVQSDQFLHFVIIRAGVRVNHLLGRLS